MRQTNWVLCTAALVLIVSGCADEGRDYAVPKKLCGVPVDANLLGPLLPAGREVEIVRESISPTEDCIVKVDDKSVLDTRGEWRNAGVSVQDEASVPASRVFGGGRYAAWKQGAFTAFSCVVPDEKVKSVDGAGKGAKILTLEVRLRAQTPDEHTEAAMKKFIVPYAKAYREKLPCEGR